MPNHAPLLVAAPLAALLLPAPLANLRFHHYHDDTDTLLLWWSMLLMLRPPLPHLFDTIACANILTIVHLDVRGQRQAYRRTDGQTILPTEDDV